MVSAVVATMNKVCSRVHCRRRSKYLRSNVEGTYYSVFAGDEAMPVRLTRGEGTETAKNIFRHTRLLAQPTKADTDYRT